MPRIKIAFEKTENGKRDWLKIFFIILLFMVGWVMMLLIAFYEDDIQFDIGC